eukprot:Gregarina_sp_Pseudo_9__574@NODE_136_length_4074_cov_82_022057_g126_i0_p2_GENE_NODE_136_length_4074_cov_82_022057_g126_i0NODE_136_length_4074_cov_82_022057_g126_i0_p2_ORF_typecomplete_len412_score62_84Epimerase/PF01370_21/8_1e403Beta_HSD/PF01073_19/6e39NAD_binding_4/PF07993_12/8_9e15NAD_binding_10/PF13460_6/2_3e13GDP_Man_Dehyd/PF16363_5/1_1e11NmrA/PF05368_13/4_2e08NmrA/PF05368_13/26RmlD_sub_bind/PF04321_17/6_5e06Polysacc_synt_2/PF02719_15/0_084adh_short_C2/PF13561_6/0_71adh_short_C2/PF13561_6/3e0
MSDETVASANNMETPLVLVTGCGGWVASHCVYQLLEKGYRVRGTVRCLGACKYDFLKTFHPKAASHLTIVEANLLTSEEWDGIVQGCDYILHVASPFNFAYKHEDDIIRPAVEGVENVYKAAIKHCDTVKRIVHTSSVVAVVYGHPLSRYQTTREQAEQAEGQVPAKSTCKQTVPTQDTFKLFTEEEWSNPDKIVGYEKSKTLAEKKAWELINKHNEEFANEPDKQISLTTILPGFVFGPVWGKVHKDGESSNQIIRIMEKTYPFVPPLCSAHVDVRDVALMHILALEVDVDKVKGQRILACADDGNMTFVEQAKLLAKHVKPWGFNPATTIAPSFLIGFGKYFLSSVKAAADKLHCVTYVSNQKSKDLLGMKSFRPTEFALLDHAVTLIKYGVITKRRTPVEVLENYKAY